jgi:hypothetical protein
MSDLKVVMDEGTWRFVRCATAVASAGSARIEALKTPPPKQG